MTKNASNDGSATLQDLLSEATALKNEYSRFEERQHLKQSPVYWRTTENIRAASEVNANKSPHSQRSPQGAPWSPKRLSEREIEKLVDRVRETLQSPGTSHHFDDYLRSYGGGGAGRSSDLARSKVQGNLQKARHSPRKRTPISTPSPEYVRKLLLKELRTPTVERSPPMPFSNPHSSPREARESNYDHLHQYTYSELKDRYDVSKLSRSAWWTVEGKARVQVMTPDAPEPGSTPKRPAIPGPLFEYKGQRKQHAHAMLYPVGESQSQVERYHSKRKQLESSALAALDRMNSKYSSSTDGPMKTNERRQSMDSDRFYLQYMVDHENDSSTPDSTGAVDAKRTSEHVPNLGDLAQEAEAERRHSMKASSRPKQRALVEVHSSSSESGDAAELALPSADASAEGCSAEEPDGSVPSATAPITDEVE